MIVSLMPDKEKRPVILDRIDVSVEQSERHVAAAEAISIGQWPALGQEPRDVSYT